MLSTQTRSRGFRPKIAMGMTTAVHRRKLRKRTPPERWGNGNCRWGVGERGVCAGAGLLAIVFAITIGKAEVCIRVCLIIRAMVTGSVPESKACR